VAVFGGPRDLGGGGGLDPPLVTPLVLTAAATGNVIRVGVV